MSTTLLLFLIVAPIIVSICIMLAFRGKGPSVHAESEHGEH